MKKFLLATAAATILATSSAYAAEGDFYLKGNVGFSAFDGFKSKHTEGNNTAVTTKYKGSKNAYFGVGVGYNIMDNVRVDLALDHVLSPEFKHSIKKGNVESSSKIKVDANRLLVNGFVDLFDVSMVKVFAGAGIGASRLSAKISNTVKNGTVSKETSFKLKDQTRFSYALYLGATTELAPGINADLAYNWSSLGEVSGDHTNKDKVKFKFEDIKLNAHNVVFSVRFDI